MAEQDNNQQDLNQAASGTLMTSCMNCQENGKDPFVDD